MIRNVLVTGAKGFIGRNLVAFLRAQGKYGIFEHDIENGADRLRRSLADCDFVFHFAGVNRPTDPADFQTGNVETTRTVVEVLRTGGRGVPVAFSSSLQAELDNPYGISKKAAEDLLIAYSRESGAKVYLYRFPNLFGKWCRPDYNSAVATFCHNIAKGLPIRVDDPRKILPLAYIDDLAREMLRILEEDPRDPSVFHYAIPVVFQKTLGEIVSMLEGWKDEGSRGFIPDTGDPFSKRLYATFLSYLDPGECAVRADRKEDPRGWLFEYVKSHHAGQVFVSSTRPGVTRGNHYHHTKAEKFCLVKGRADILLRRIDSTEVARIPVTDNDIRIVTIPPGYTHAITNTGDADMIVLFWASEVFQPDQPDTYPLFGDAMKRLKLMTVIGTRPEIIRLSAVIRACDRYFQHILVHTGQNWDFTLNEIFFRDFQLRKPDFFLEAAGRHLGETIGNMISRSYEVLVAQRPDALLILGDTNSALCAIPAKRCKVPIFHMEAGNRCFDQNVPEEINRKIVDHISDVNLPYTEHSRRYLLSEGFPKERIFVTGSPMTEVLSNAAESIGKSGVLREFGLEPGGYFTVSMHREENLDREERLQSLVEALNRTASHYGKPIIFSTHPRTLKKIQERSLSFHPLIRNVKPLGFFDYVKLQKESFCVISDSGTLSEESAILHYPGVLLRDSTERPEAVDAGTVVIGGISAEGLRQAIDMAVDAMQGGPREIPADYAGSRVSVKVARIIQGYTRIVDKTVWGKTTYGPGSET